MAAAEPIVLTCPDGGVAEATLDVTTSTPSTVHSLFLSISRGWIDLLLGTSSGGGEISNSVFGVESVRLGPGDHVLSFAPGASTFYITAKRDREGLAAITEMYFLQGGDLVLPTPYEDSDLASLRMTQSLDVKWIFNGRHAPRKLIRYSNSSWGLAFWLPEDGPFQLSNDVDITLTPAAQRGSGVTVTASAGLFKADHIGSLVRLTHPGQSVSANVTAEDDWTDAVRVSGVEDSRVFTVNVSGSFSATVTLQRSVGDDVNWQDVQTLAAGNHQIDDGFDNSIIYYRVGVKAGDFTSGTAALAITYGAGETTGIGRIITVADVDEVTVDVIEPFGAVNATRSWAQGAWSYVNGWPSCGDLFDGRLWTGASLSLFASVPDDFDSFELGVDDAGAIQRTIGVGDASPLRWIKGALRLHLGNDAGSADIDAVRIGDADSMQVRSSAFDEPLTPTNMTMRQVSAKVAYVDVSATRVMRLNYDVDTNSFVSDDLNRLHADIGFFGGGFIDLAFQQRPFSRLWAPRADGQMPCVTLSEQEQVVGWSRLRLGQQSAFAALLAAEEADNVDADVERAAAVVSVCVTPSVSVAQREQDYVHMIVERVLNGRRVRCHERLARERWKDAEDACFLECARRYQGAPARYLYNLDHLVGETVYVWGDGAQWGPFEVVDLSTLDASFVDGEIGVDLGEGNTVEDAWVGLEMRTRYVSGKLAYGARAGSAVGEVKRSDHITMLFHKTALGNVFVGMVDGNLPDPFVDIDGNPVSLTPVPDVAEGFYTDAAAPLFTGELDLTLDTRHMRDPRLAIEIRGCAPAAILGYVVNMNTTERS